ncbi:MAG: hypothetical protein U0270_44560 [Labilithrix sp.]
MESPSPIQYAAHTATCTFLLDSEGMCRKIVMAPNASASPRARETARAAARCIGAQYVASLDGSAPGLLTDTPKVGTAMLFARTDDNGRISLVRTGHVTRFERHVEEDPFVEHERPSVVATSAPPLSPSVAPTPRRPSMLPPPDPYNDDERVDDRTKPVHALRHSDIRELRRNGSSAIPPSSEPATMRNPTIGPPPRRSDVAPRPGVSVQKPMIRRRG